MPVIENIQKKHKKHIIQLVEEINREDKLNYSLSSEWLDYIIENENKSVFIATYKDIVAGLATSMINKADKSHAIINIIVHPDYRRQGIGRKLYERIDHYIEEKRIKTIECYIKKRLDKSMNFIKKRGFQPVHYGWEMELPLAKKKLNSSIEDLHTSSTFRKATPSTKDSLAYAKIINHTFGDRLDKTILKQVLADTSIEVYFLEKEKEIIGSTTIQYKEELSIAYIYDVAIVKEHRGQGLGSYMLEKALENIIKNKIEKASLSVMGGDNAPLSLYKKAGFKVVDLDVIMKKKR